MNATKFTIALLGCLALAACETRPQRPTPQADGPGQAVCTNCGRVERIEIVPVTTSATDRGAVLGGVVGGVLSKPAAPGTAPPTTAKNYRIGLRMDDGRRLVLTQKVISAHLKIGSRVRLDGSRIVLLR
jgi:outer membrane lipoprotein SlyB